VTSPAHTLDERQRRLVFDMVATRALAQVLEALGSAGIPCVPVKGVVLARWLYADVSERPYVDVDLLVPRSVFQRSVALVDARGWRSFYRTTEMGELGFMIDRVAVELHAEVGRRDLSRLSVDDVLARATPDTTTFPFEILRIDEVDHFLLLVLNVVKDGFTYANPHQPTDLERLLERLAPRQDELIQRAAAAGLTTALHLTAAWMEHRHGSAAFGMLGRILPPHGRSMLVASARAHEALDTRAPNRLRTPGALVGLALATLVPDDFRLRRRGLWRLIRRGVLRRLGRDPG
jgi:hypothetical protein